MASPETTKETTVDKSDHEQIYDPNAMRPEEAHASAPLH
jgi:hypothetical protein